MELVAVLVVGAIAAAAAAADVPFLRAADALARPRRAKLPLRRSIELIAVGLRVVILDGMKQRARKRACFSSLAFQARGLLAEKEK